MSKSKTFGEFIDDSWKVIKAAGKGEVLHSNKAINPLTNFTGGIEATGRVIKGEGFSEAMRNTFGKRGTDGKLLTGDKAGWSAGKIAGSYIGAAAIGRVATGGGLYRDKNGNTNIVGVPFV